MIIFPIYVKNEYKNKFHAESLPIYAFKSKEADNESYFNLLVTTEP